MANNAMMCDRCGNVFMRKENAGGLSAGKAAVGAILAGPAGAIVGAAMGKTSKNDCCPFCGSYSIHYVK